MLSPRCIHCIAQQQCDCIWSVISERKFQPCRSVAVPPLAKSGQLTGNRRCLRYVIVQNAAPSWSWVATVTRPLRSPKATTRSSRPASMAPIARCALEATASSAPAFSVRGNCSNTCGHRFTRLHSLDSSDAARLWVLCRHVLRFVHAAHQGRGRSGCADVMSTTWVRFYLLQLSVAGPVSVGWHVQSNPARS